MLTMLEVGVTEVSSNWACLDSNQGPRDYESPALTAVLQALRGIVAAASCVTGRGADMISARPRSIRTRGAALGEKMMRAFLIATVLCLIWGAAMAAPSTQKQYRLVRSGTQGPFTFKLVDAPVRQPGAPEVLVRVH